MGAGFSLSINVVLVSMVEQKPQKYRFFESFLGILKVLFLEKVP